MKAVIQRVKSAGVTIKGQTKGKIEKGLLVFLAIHRDDTEDKAEKLADKILKLRIFNDQEEKMNLSVSEARGSILAVSQFTLYGNCRKGNRPSFIESARPEKAIPFYEKFVSYIKAKGINIETGEFGAMMEVDLVNDGPVTLIIDN